MAITTRWAVHQEQSALSTLAASDRRYCIKDNHLFHPQTFIHCSFNSFKICSAYPAQLRAFLSAIHIRDFDSLIRGKTENSQDAIELLVLSACETAKGNKQSAMGIAGIAAQAGARSTVATLWRVEADSTALLMQDIL